MQVFQPRSLEEALVEKARHPEAVPLAGGTDLLVELNFGRLRPPAFIDLTRVEQLSAWHQQDGLVFVGAGVTYATIVRELTDFIPLVQASRSVGSPQIRNRGTMGGNLGTASPAGDTLPVLAAYDAEILLRSSERGERSVPWREFLVGPKKTSLAPDELILGARWRRLRGAGSFSKVGTRNAMVISIVGLCLAVDEERRQVKVALGSVGPTMIRAEEAERSVAGSMEAAGAWEDPQAPIQERHIADFAALVAKAARPIDDVRGTAAYRRHATQVLARRALTWALEDRKLGRWMQG